MSDSSAAKKNTVPAGPASSQRVRRRFTPAQRDPFFLPNNKIELPAPPTLQGSAPQLNLLMTLLSPALMIGMSLLTALITGGKNLAMILPMLGIGLAMPLANIIGTNVGKKKWDEALVQREAAYKQRLEKERAGLKKLAEEQRSVLEKTYPVLDKLKRSAKTQDRLLWSRRPHDEDFLALRLGLGSDAPSFKIEPPRTANEAEPLNAWPQKLLAEFREIPNVPRLLPLAQSGSLAISGRNQAAVYGAARRLMIDVIVHHSPQDVFVFVLGDTPEAEQRWEWLKWVPHTDALGVGKKSSRLAYTAQTIEKTLEFLSKELSSRTKQSGGSESKKGRTPAMVVVVDDTGRVRAREDVIQLTEQGADAGIHLIFTGGRDWPRECKSRIDLVDDRRYKFTETWSRERAGHEGIYEIASLPDSEAIARGMGGIETASSQTSTPLPKSIRLSEVIGIEDFSAETVKKNWAVPLEPKDLLQFPIGVKAKRDHLEMELINLLPAERGGSDAYHTILIGTTGSGKSEFMKSLVMGAAYRYSPLYLNLFFMDFKGGAAFSVFENLPHVSGIVTNLKPELVERGLDSVTNEIERRQAEFAAAKVQNIWDYNRNHPEAPMPHLVLFLDEFARGLADFPRLREPLDVLVRQGRSLGVYLILANQDVNSEVDKLLNNVGWRIALKVAKPDEMAIIDRTLPIATRAGHGYLRALSGDISEFQAGYGGYPIRSDEETTVEGFSIYRVDPDGVYQEVFKKQAGEATSAKKGTGRAPREEEQLVKILRQATEELNLKPASKIYLEPLEEVIPLEKNMIDTGIHTKYADGNWRTEPALARLVAAVGEVDLPKQCRQEQLAIDFDDRDGHLWLLGAPGSGKDTSLVAILMSIALTYTPEEVQFYLLEMGAGELVPLENLPHTGVCIRLQATEKERLERLFNFLDAEMERRIAESAKSESEHHRCLPVIFLVINNTAEFRANFPDEADRVNRYVRDGKAAGIHIFVTTNRSAELMRTVANNISRRLVMQLSSRDEYFDAVGKSVPMLHIKAPGRGYWVDGDAWECQIAQPPQQLRELIRNMKSGWQGSVPRQIQILRPSIGLAEVLERIDTKPGGPLLLPVGQSYETLDWILPNVAEQLPCWMILGPKESGKSNFLCAAALAALKCDPKNWIIKAYAFRRSPIVALAKQDPRIQLYATLDEIQKDAQAMADTVKEGKQLAEGKRILWLIDDFSFAFQTGKEAVLAPFNQIAQGIDNITNLHILGSGLMEEFRMSLASPMIKIMRQSRQGMVMSKDSNELDWLGAQVSLAYRKMELPAGRGFYVSKGKPYFVQTPMVEIKAAPSASLT
jgi:S-DNA-T family DNA segregation ATPase FtsK/SpoIIIE